MKKHTHNIVIGLYSPENAKALRSNVPGHGLRLGLTKAQSKDLKYIEQLFKTMAGRVFQQINDEESK